MEKKLEETLSENELDTSLIRSACSISVYNSMNKTKVMKAMDLS